MVRPIVIAKEMLADILIVYHLLALVHLYLGQVFQLLVLLSHKTGLVGGNKIKLRKYHLSHCNCQDSY
jgi:hypothetical protein